MKVLRSISVIALAFLVLVSSTNISMSLHLCMGKVKDWALLSHASNCGMPAEVADHSDCDSPQVDATSCCEDQTVVKNVNEQVFKSNASFSSEFVAVAFFILTELHLDNSITGDGLKTYRPPIVSRDIPVLIQSFLI